MPTFQVRVIETGSAVNDIFPYDSWQVALWQREMKLGAVAYDTERREVYFAEPDKETQKSFLDGIQALTVNEVHINAMVLLAELAYYETQVTVHLCAVNTFCCLFSFCPLIMLTG